jgi:hypothetical protein
MTNPLAFYFFKRAMRKQLKRVTEKWQAVSDKWCRASTYWSLRKLGFPPIEAKRLRDIYLTKAWEGGA